jgi:hypothetical protein
VPGRGWLPRAPTFGLFVRATLLQFFLGDADCDLPAWNIDLDDVAFFNKRNGAALCGFG